MVVGRHRKTIAYIDKEAIFSNVQQELQRLNEKTELYAVVKANGYGHGAVEVAKVAKKAGATGFCVAILDEALELREAGFTEPILVLGIVDVRYAELMASNHISVTVSSIKWLHQAEAALAKGNSSAQLAVHVALDTGMGRIGFKTADEVKAVEAWFEKHKRVYFEGIFTHFAKADSPDDQLFKQQIKKFNVLLNNLHQKPRYIHTANSATALWHQESSFNLIRFGIAMYGLNPSGGALTAPYPLKPAMKLITEISYVKQMQAGETIGYGGTYTAHENEWIGTLPIGYGDGWRRDLQGQDVLVNGQRCEIVGRVCMDQCMIRLPYEVVEGTEVVLVGQSQDETISLQEIADHVHTIHYEIACGLTERIPRKYV